MKNLIDLVDESKKEDTPKKNVTTSIRLSHEQYNFLKKQKINISLFFRKLIEKIMSEKNEKN